MTFIFGKIRIQIACSLDHTHVDGRYDRCFEHGRFVGFMNKEHCTPLDFPLHDCIVDARQDI